MNIWLEECAKMEIEFVRLQRPTTKMANLGHKVHMVSCSYFYYLGCVRIGRVREEDDAEKWLPSFC
jgi:hypothetical protein